MKNFYHSSIPDIRFCWQEFCNRDLDVFGECDGSKTREELKNLNQGFVRLQISSIRSDIPDEVYDEIIKNSESLINMQEGSMAGLGGITTYFKFEGIIYFNSDPEDQEGWERIDEAGVFLWQDGKMKPW